MVPYADPAGPELTLAAFKKFTSQSSEFRTHMAGGVQQIGYDGPASAHFDLGTESNTQKDGALTATTQMHTTIDVAFAGSDVTARFDTDIHNTVTDTKTGYTTYTETTRQSMAGELDACPNAAGLVPASLEITNDEDASTFAGGGGQGDSRATGHSQSTSKFRGTADDTATLGPVSQDYSHNETFKQTGGPAPKEGSMTFGMSGIGDGVPAPTVNEGLGARFGDWSGATQTAAELTGDATQALIDRLPFDAGYAWTTMETSYTEAQKVWRDTRCVIVTAPDYIAASEFAFNAKPTHTEDVDKGSTTQFQIGLDHRYKQAVTAKVTAKLDGKESVSPELIEKPPGQLTYVAPDSDGNDATVLLEIGLPTGDRQAQAHVPYGHRQDQGVDQRDDDDQRVRRAVLHDPPRLEHPVDQDLRPARVLEGRDQLQVHLRRVGAGDSRGPAPDRGLQEALRGEGHVQAQGEARALQGERESPEVADHLGSRDDDGIQRWVVRGRIDRVVRRHRGGRAHLRFHVRAGRPRLRRPGRGEACQAHGHPWHRVKATNVIDATVKAEVISETGP